MNTRVRTSQGLELAAEQFPGEGPPILLVMGLGAQMLLWHDAFCEQLAARGHRVIRFDNRDVGESTRLDDQKVPSVPMSYLRARLRLEFDPVYTLSDMASDAIDVLDHFQIPKATMVGASMGGMIAQHAARSHPERLSGLVSVMSSARPAKPRARAIRALLRRPAPGREGYIAHTLHFFEAIGSTTHRLPADQVSAMAGRCFDRGPSPQGFARQFEAILADGDRAPWLNEITVPSLVIHGDEDPLIPLRHGIRSAKLMGARLEVVRGMGHDLPLPCWPVILDSISRHAKAHSKE